MQNVAVDDFADYEDWLKENFVEPTSVQLCEMQKYFKEQNFTPNKPINNPQFYPKKGA